ncbi:hypothetical protein FACS1894130_06280 [Spirochaetia bacterium]|nr:hypothetical protein FACS1894130_06280 [Spirochaetia bacterium]
MLSLYIPLTICNVGAAIFLIFRTRKLTAAKNNDDSLRSKNQISQLLLQKRQEQLNALQSQINPHFLYNTLDTIRGLAVEKGSPEIANIVAALSSMFQYSMDYGGTIVPLSSEIIHTEAYLKIQNLRFPGKFTFNLIHDFDDAAIGKISIPKMTLQPIVENAASHGFRNMNSGAVITMRLILSDQSTEIRIRDNGAGISEQMVLALNRSFSESKSEERLVDPVKFGIALSNIDLRIKIYFGDRYGLHITSTAGLGTEVTISLPPEKEYDI